MHVRITGRHVVITEALRRYIENRMRRLDRYGVELGEVQVVVVVEKYRHIAEAVKPPGLATVRPPLQMMTVREALNRLSADRSPLVVFVNASVNRIQVVRRTDNGTVELIDPQPPSRAAS